MKKQIKIFISCLLLGSSVACSPFKDDDLSIAVTDSDDLYRIKANYNKDKTWKLYKYINKSIKPNGLFASEDDYMDVNTELSDHTKFYVKASPGKLIIKLKKDENSHESYQRMKKMGEGIKGVLAD